MGTIEGNSGASGGDVEIKGGEEEGGRTMEGDGSRREEEEGEGPSRIESELDLRLAGIKTFETSTGQQDRLQLNHSSSCILSSVPPYPPWLCLSLGSPALPPPRRSASPLPGPSNWAQSSPHLPRSSRPPPRRPGVLHSRLIAARSPGLSASRGVP